MSPDAIAAVTTRLALVIGNSAYPAAALRNPCNDARAISTKLEGLGFKVTTELDVDAASFQRAVGAFCRELGEAGQRGETSAGVLFFAGHGIQVDGENYLLPVDVNVRNLFELKHQCIELDVVMEAMGAAARTSVVLLDCCRDNPLPPMLGPGGQVRGLSSGHGLANVRAPKGVYVAFSTQPHFVALDGAGANSPFAEALIAHIDEPAINITDVLMRVRRHVYDATGGQQIPWDHSALFEPFKFVPGDPAVEAIILDEAARQKLHREQEKAREQNYWQMLQRSDDIDFIQSFAAQFPNSAHRAAALARIDRIKGRGRRRRFMALLAVAAVGLITAYLASLWFRMTTLPDADIVSGDIETGDGFRGFEDSPLRCRLRCLTDRFDQPCRAFSYDEKDKKCYPKFEAIFYTKPSKTASNPVFSEVMPGYAAPTESSFQLIWDRVLVGEPTAAEDVTRAPGSFVPNEDALAKRKYWIVKGGGECQKLCGDLAGACAAFSYSRSTLRCELFATVKGIVRDSVSGNPVHVPGTFSGCKDANAPTCQ